MDEHRRPGSYPQLASQLPVGHDVGGHLGTVGPDEAASSCSSVTGIESVTFRTGTGEFGD